MEGTIYTLKRGKKSYVYWKYSYREKEISADQGKTRNTGKSKVITKQKYLGTLEEVYKICLKSRVKK